VAPVVEDHMLALPATGAVVVLVKQGRIFYSRGFGTTGALYVDPIGNS